MRSGVQALTIAPDRGSTISIRNRQVDGCKVCVGSGRSRQCRSYWELKDSTAVEFDCSKPEDVFNVEIVRNIGKSGVRSLNERGSTVNPNVSAISECTTKSCNGRVVQADSGSLPLAGFNRKYTWNVKASSPKSFKIDFGNVGLRQINVTDRCPDRHSYTLQAFQTTSSVVVGKYCRVGQISSAQVLNQGSFSVDVPAREKLQMAQFDVRVGDEIKCELS